MSVSVFWKCTIQTENPLPSILHIRNVNYFCNDRNRRSLKTFCNSFRASLSSSAYAGFTPATIFRAVGFTFVISTAAAFLRAPPGHPPHGHLAGAMLFCRPVQGLFSSGDTLAACQISWICIGMFVQHIFEP